MVDMAGRAISTTTGPARAHVPGVSPPFPMGPSMAVVAALVILYGGRGRARPTGVLDCPGLDVGFVLVGVVMVAHKPCTGSGLFSSRRDTHSAPVRKGMIESHNHR